ncbi:HAD-IIIC family phosphatase [Prosthecobacter sp.]|uniref:HAD-IIIC family phosphatase n=1 Tax=Prosthecobacter sp. TaxID=1965333 RepID=UPI003783E82F
MTRAEYAQAAAGVLREKSPALRWLRLALLSSFTVDLMKPCLVVEAAQRGLGLEVWAGPYGQIDQQIMDARSELYREAPDVVVILARVEDLMPELAWQFLRQTPEDLQQARTALSRRMEGLVRQVLAQHAKAKVLLGNFALPQWLAAGEEDALLEVSQVSFWQQLNDDMAALCRRVPQAVLVDVAAAAVKAGADAWTDARMAWLARAPLSAHALEAVARRIARRLQAVYHPPKKCLVLDMDDTLWGGILGEAGMGGIALGPDYPGNVFVDFQRRVLALRDRGILLAAASKNNAEEVLQVLAEHPACLLKREHFAAFEVHWQDKAGSLRGIAQKLKLGVDALVFFDDNPVERDWVRSQLPEVAVVPVPKHVMDYGRALEEGGWFDTAVLSEEDRLRAGYYAQEEARAGLRGGAASLEDFIRSLEMKVTVSTVTQETLPRVVQLLGKTNQFNLTTRRHTTAELERMMAGGAVAVWARVEDRFGDNGIVGVGIALPDASADAGGVWMLDTLLLSCRVLGRGVETALLAVVEREVARLGARQLRGEFIPTARNQPAADFFEKHGYHRAAQAGGAWERSLDAARPLPECFVLHTLVSPPS